MHYLPLRWLMYSKRSIRPNEDERHYLLRSKWITLAWGILAILFANLFNLFDNLIELVNIIGSLFYGTILGIFITAFFIPFVKSRAIFIAGIMSEITILCIYFLSQESFCQDYLEQKGRLIELEYLWLNIIAPCIVLVLAVILQFLLKKK